jgi:hypothetical protein
MGMKYLLLSVMSLVLPGFVPSLCSQVAAPTVKVSTPTIPKRPKFFFLEAPEFNVLVHPGEGEQAAEGSLVINGYKNDPNTSLPIDFWIFGTVLKRQGELHSVVLTKFAESGDELLLILFLKHRGMENAVVILYRPEVRGLQVLKELEDLGPGNSVEIVRMRCERDPVIMEYFLMPKPQPKEAGGDPVKEAIIKAAK